MALQWTVKPGGGGTYTDIVAAVIAAFQFNATGQSDITITTFPGDLSTTSGLTTIDSQTYTYNQPFNLTVIANASTSATDFMLPSTFVSALSGTLSLANWDCTQSGNGGGTLSIQGLQLGNATNIGSIRISTATTGVVVTQNISAFDCATRGGAVVLFVAFDNTAITGAAGSQGIWTVSNILYGGTVSQTGNVYVIEPSTVASAPFHVTMSGCSADERHVSGSLTKILNLGSYAAGTLTAQYNAFFTGGTGNAFTVGAATHIDPASGFNTSNDTSAKYLNATNYRTGSSAAGLWPYSANLDYRLPLLNATNASIGTISLGAPAPVATDINGVARPQNGLVYGGASAATTNFNWQVATTGSDITGNGTIQKPFATPLPTGLTAIPYQAFAGDTITLAAGTMNLSATPYSLVGGVTMTGAGTTTLLQSQVIFQSATVGSPGVAIAFHNGGTLTNFNISLNATTGYQAVGLLLDRFNGEFPPGYNATATQQVYTPTTTLLSNIAITGSSDCIYAQWDGTSNDSPDATFDPPPMHWILQNCTGFSRYDTINGYCQYDNNITGPTTFVLWPNFSIDVIGGTWIPNGPYGAANTDARAFSTYSFPINATNSVAIALNGNAASIGSPSSSQYTCAVHVEDFGTFNGNGCVLMSNSSASSAYDVVNLGSSSSITLTNCLCNSAKFFGAVTANGCSIIPLTLGVTRGTTDATVTVSATAYGSNSALTVASTLQWSIDAGATWTTFSGTTFTATGGAKKTIQARALDAAGGSIGLGAAGYTVPSGNAGALLVLGIL